jgi:hypothetical protein
MRLVAQFCHKTTLKFRIDYNIERHRRDLTGSNKTRSPRCVGASQSACGGAGVQTGPSEPRGRHGRRLCSDHLLQCNSGDPSVLFEQMVS